MALETAAFTDAWVRHVERGRIIGGVRAEERTAFAFLADGEVEQERITFGALEQRVAAAAEALGGVVPAGERAILLYPSGIDFIVAFLGCLAARVIAVPVSVPNPRTGLDTLRAIARDSGATNLLSTPALLGKFQPMMAADELLCSIAVHDTTSFPTRPAGTRAMSGASGGDIALLQYTSGSTGNPRGVAVTHANLVENHRQAERGFGTSAESIVVSWLPMFHDMGLGTVLHSLWLGAPCILMSPAAFLQKPVRWLQAISRYRVTMSGGPDFAYDLCARRIGPEEKRKLDLSSWQTAYNGSEPIRAEVVRRFIREFAACNFLEEAFHPVYGLAEATLMVTAKPPLEPNPLVRFSREGLARGSGALHGAGDSADAVELVGCGTTWLDGQVQIVQPETHEALESGQVGEIWVSGPCVAAGYWGKPEETRATFRAHTRDGRGPFLRTGDLGMVCAGQLFITGRLKDLIIVRGKNHYPQDIEASVSSCHPALEPHRAAAVSLPPGSSGGSARLLIVQEVRRTALDSFDAEEVFEAIRGAVSCGHGIEAHAIVLIQTATLLRTTSGKVRRKATLEAYLSGTLVTLARCDVREDELREDELREDGSDRPGRTVLEAEQQEALRRRIEVHVGAWVAKHKQVAVAAIDPQASIVASGIDSLARVDLVRSLEGLLGVTVSESELHAVDSFADLSQLLLRLCVPGQSEAAASHTGDGRRGAAQGTQRIVLPGFTPIKWH